MQNNSCYEMGLLCVQKEKSVKINEQLKGKITNKVSSFKN